jgi:preprotein translocase subunit SecG
MSILISVLLIVEVLAAFLLIVVILAQKSKDQGLGMAFGGGMGESLFGSRAGNVLTRMTITLTVVFMATTILLGILFAKGRVGSGSVMDRADRQAPAAPVAAPVAPAPVAPMLGDDMAMPMTMEAPAAPMALQMGADGELVPLQPEAGVDLEPPAAEPVPQE